MTEKDFAALLGCDSTSTKDLAIERAIALMHSALSGLMPDQRECFLSDIRDTTVVVWDGTAIILKNAEGNIYRVAPGIDGCLMIDQDHLFAFNLLFVEGSLDKVLNHEAVAELHRLQAEVVAEASAKTRNAEMAEYKRLKAKYG